MKPTRDNNYNISLNVCNCLTFHWCNMVRTGHDVPEIPSVLRDDFMMYLQSQFPSFSFQEETGFVWFTSPSDIHHFIQAIVSYSIPQFVAC